MLALINGNAHYGGGSLIRRNQSGRAVVLTAAHCLNYDLNNVTVRGGSLKWHSGGETAKVREYYVHPDYALPAGIDLAVLILDGPLQGVALAPTLAGQHDGALYQTGSQVTMAGWGPVGINGDSWNDLQVLTLPLVSPGSCDTEDRDSNADFACCRSNDKHSTPGDSGGPMIGGSQDSRKLVGVIEGGKGGASIATRVDKQAAWLADPAHVHSYVVGTGPAGATVVPAAAGRRYVLHNDGGVSVFDAAWAPQGSLQVPESVRAIAGSPVGTSAYIADRKGISTIDAGTGKLTRSVGIPERPSILAVTADGQFLAVSHGSSVTIVAAADLATVKTFAIGNEPSAIAMAPDSKHLYVTCAEDSEVRTLEISGSAKKSWENGGYGNSCVAATANHVYVSEFGGAVVSVRDVSGEEKGLLELRVNREVKALAVSGNRVYVGYETTNSQPTQVGVEVFDAGDHSRLYTRQFGTGPLGPLTPVAGGVLAVNQKVSSISVVSG